MFLVLTIIGRTCSSSNGIYYEGKISPYRILQKIVSAFYNSESVEVTIESWFQSPAKHTKFKFKNLIKNMDDSKVEGRVSSSSLIPNDKFSTSSWVQSYTIRGIPFTWESQNGEWKKETQDIEEKKTRKMLQESFLKSLFYLNEESIDFSTMEFLGEEDKRGTDCFVIKYKIKEETFGGWELVSDITVKIWADKKTFLPLASRLEGKLGYMSLLQMVDYHNYNAQLEFDPPAVISEEVKKEKDALVNKINDLFTEVARIRGWKDCDLESVKVEFVKRRDIGDMIIEGIKSEYSPGEIKRDEKILKWLRLIPGEADYSAMLANSQLRLVSGIYEPERKAIFLGDWLEPPLAEVICVHEIVHAFQDERIGLERFLKYAGDDLDLKFALKSLIEGEAFAVSFEYLLRKDNESFREWEDVFSLVKKRFGGDFYSGNKIFYNIYGYGGRFIQACLKRYEWDQLDMFYEDFPISMEEIMHPKKYFLRKQISKKETANNGKKNILMFSSPTGWKNIYSTSIGEYLLFLSLDVLLERDISQKASSGWGSDSLIIYENIDSENVFFLLTAWDTKDDAREFFGAYRTWLEKDGFESVSEESENLSFFSGEGKEKIVVNLVRNSVAVIRTDNLNEESFNLFVKEILSQLGEKT